MLIEEYHPTFVHDKGVDNNAADALSRLDMIPNDTDEINWEPPHKKMVYSDQAMNLCMLFNAMEFEDGPLDETLYPTVITEEKAKDQIQDKYWDCEFSLDVNMFKAHQDKDKELQNIMSKAKLLQGISSYSIKAVEGVELIHFNNKIVVPKTLQERVMEWYHHHLCHPGETKMERSMNAIYFWQNM